MPFPWQWRSQTPTCSLASLATEQPWFWFCIWNTSRWLPCTVRTFIRLTQIQEDNYFLCKTEPLFLHLDNNNACLPLTFSQSLRVFSLSLSLVFQSLPTRKWVTKEKYLKKEKKKKQFWPPPLPLWYNGVNGVTWGKDQGCKSCKPAQPRTWRSLGSSGPLTILSWRSTRKPKDKHAKQDKMSATGNQNMAEGARKEDWTCDTDSTDKKWRL